MPKRAQSTEWSDSSMVKPQQVGKNMRMSFSKIDEMLEMPNLIEIQKESYQMVSREGTYRRFCEDVSPITDYSGNLFIEFVGYSIDANAEISLWRNARRRDVNYAAPLQSDGASDQQCSPAR